MKKYLIVLATALVALASCNGNNENVLTGISFKQTEVGGLYGDTIRLTLVATPAEAALPDDIVWSSSDTDVVQVIDKKGNIALLKSGNANVTAQSGDMKAVCKVQVYTYEEGWAPAASSYYFPSTKSELPVSDTVITYTTSKATYECKLYSIQICWPSALDLPGGDPGEGEWIYATIVAPFIEHATRPDSAQFIGEIWDIAFQIVPDDAVNNTKFGAFSGEIDPEITGAAWQWLCEVIDALPDTGKLTSEHIQQFEEKYDPGVFGVYVKDAMTDGQYIYSNPWVDGVITAGYCQTLYDDDSQPYASYKLIVDWCDGYVPGLGYCGLQTDLQNAQTYSEILVQPFALNLFSYYYETGALGREYTPASAPRKLAASKKFDKRNMLTRRAVKKLMPVKYNEIKSDK